MKITENDDDKDTYTIITNSQNDWTESYMKDLNKDFENSA